MITRGSRRARSRARTSGHGIPGSSPDWYAAHRRSSAALKAATASGESSGCVGSKLAKSSSATAARALSLRASASAITLAAADVAMKAGYRGRDVAGSARARCSTPPKGDTDDRGGALPTLCPRAPDHIGDDWITRDAKLLDVQQALGFVGAQVDFAACSSSRAPGASSPQRRRASLSQGRLLVQ